MKITKEDEKLLSRIVKILKKVDKMCPNRKYVAVTKSISKEELQEMFPSKKNAQL